jgi:predicted extracellular nuclease
MRISPLLLALTVATISSGANALSNNLFFSEYVEGSGNNKAYEIYNGTGAAVDLSTYSVELYNNGATTPNSTELLSGTVEADDVLVICNASADQPILDACNLISTTTFFNGDDALVLNDNGTVIDVIGQVGYDPGSEWYADGVGTQNETIRRLPSVTDGDTNPADAFDPSIEWESFAINTFDNLGIYGDSTAPPIVFKPIYDIQGASHTSPLVGSSVSTSGIVTAVDSNAFYLQDLTGDDDVNTSDAILVYTGSTPPVAVGDVVEVSGTVTEYTPGGTSTNNLSTTEITGASVTVQSSGNLLPPPVVIGASGRVPPTETIDDDNFTLFDPENDGIDFYESMEAMRVRVDAAVAVSPTNRFGETWVVANNGAFATRMNSRGGITIIDTDFNPERIQLQNDSTLTPSLLDGVNTGDFIGNPVGVVSYSFGNFEILMTESGTLVSRGLLPESASLTSDDDNLLVASYNVLNLDPNDSDGDTDVADGRFDAIAAHIVGNLNTPDIVALQEIQDSDGAFDTGITDSSVTADTLIAAIQAAGGPLYAYIDIAPVDNMDGGQPGANIRVGYLYNPARVVLDPLSVVRIEDSDLTDGDAFEDSRKPLAATFEFNGETLHFINAHLASKGGSSPLFGTIQPIINGKEEQREAQAQEIVDFVDAIYAGDMDARVVVLGDMNAFFFESPLQILESVGTNLNTLVDDTEAYSYIFQGNSQALDHVLVSDSVRPVASSDIVHVNAEFADYASDHDPLLLQIRIPEPPVTMAGILEVFEQAVADGELDGNGKSPVAQTRRLIAFRKLLEKIDVRIESEKTAPACALTANAIRKSDEIGNDWIAGPATATINGLLVEFAALNCQ